MRWRQVVNPATGKSEFVPIDEAALRHDSGGAAIHGIFEPFRSVVDGTLISTAKQLREHNKRNNVVCSGEFSDEWYDKKRKERERLYTGENTREETHKRRQQIYESWVQAEREAGH